MSKRCNFSFSAVFLSLFFLLASDCLAANKPDNKFTENKIEPLAKSSSVMVLPLNPNRLLKDKEIDELFKELVVQLKGRGASVQNGVIEGETDRFDYFLLTSRQAQSHPDSFAAKQEYVRAVAGNNPIVVIPSVIEKAADVSGQKMYLDGNKLAIRRDGPGGGGDWRGQQRGLSLKLEVFDKDGNWLMSVFGGVAMPRYADMSTKQFYRKDYLFEDKRDHKSMVKGVKVALKPFFSKLKFK